MAQESLDKELFGGLGGPRYGTTIDPSSRNAASKSKGGDLYSFLPAQWGIGGASGAASIDSKRQQEIMVTTQSQEQELGTYFPQTGGPRYYVKQFSLVRNPNLICFYMQPPDDYESEESDEYEEEEEEEEEEVPPPQPAVPTATVPSKSVMPIPTAVSKSVGTSAVKSKPREQEKVLLEKEKEKEKDKAAVPPPMPKVQSKYPFS